MKTPNNLVRKHLGLLGYKVKDKVTGFAGVVDSVSFDLYGCVCASLRPPVNEKGELPDGRWFDVSRLEVSNEQVMTIPNYEWGVQAEGKQGSAEKSYKREAIA